MAALEASANGILITDTKGRILWANPAVTALTGYSKAELLGNNPRMFKSGRQAPDVYKQLWETILSGRVWHGEIVNCRKDGSLYSEEMTVTPVRAGGAGVTNFIAIKQDVTARKRAEEALQESETRYRILFENMLNGLVYCRMIFEEDRPTDFIYLAANNAFEILTGLKDVVGRKATEVIPGIRESDPQLFEVYGRVARTRVSEKFEIYVKSLRQWFTVSAFSPRLDHFVAVFEVITDRKNAEFVLKRLVAARTAELEAANKSLRLFAYGLAHDLRSPLRVIHRYGQLLSESLSGALVPADHEALAHIKAGSEQMDRLITELLGLSRVSQMELHLQRLETEPIVRKVLVHLASEIEKSGAEIAIEPGLPAVMGDHTLLEEALDNLLSNAIKFVPAGVRPRVRVWGVRREEAVRLYVEDNGIGIEPSQYKRIFKPLQRLVTARQYPGSGMGLALAASAVRLMQGKVSLEAKPGGGSRFWIELRGPQGEPR